MLKTWKKQFTVKQLSLEHENPVIFIISQWQKQQKPNIWYLVYRWVIAIIFFTTFVISILDLKHPDGSASFKAKWLIYLTNWGYTCCTLQALLAAIILSVYLLAPYLRSKPKQQNSTLSFYKLYWVINIIATDIAFGITLLYWSLIYDGKTMHLDAMNVLVHANNSILMMIDLFIVAHPIRLLHCCYPMLLGICYALFSVIFYAAGGISREGTTYIYHILNWSKAGISIAICLGVLILIAIVHGTVYGIYNFRQWIYDKAFHKNKPDEKVLQKNLSNIVEKVYDNGGLANDTV